MKNVALITGASTGIGRELAIIHAKSQGDLVLVARRKHLLDSLADDLREKYKISILVKEMDLAKIESGTRLAEELIKENIHIQYLFNNAGFGGYGEFIERNISQDLSMIQLNVCCLVELTHAIAKQMTQNGGGMILNTASTAGFIPGPLQATYFATKAFVVSFSQALDQELRKKGVTVTALCPGPVQTEFIDVAGMSKSKLFEGAKTASYTAKKGYNAMLKKKLICISDPPFYFLINYLMWLVPRRTILRIIEKLQRIN
ncbi:MAG: SDR family oxidoreductase [Bacteroidetes bacterium]|nr:SDR family oxidoreductase [Bacteroidota bacterium]